MELVRVHPGPGQPGDEIARAWVCQRVEQQVRAMGEPRPAIYVVFPDHADMFDLSKATAADPGGDPGATWAALREQTGAVPTLLVLRVDSERDGQPEQAAVVMHLHGSPPQLWLGWLTFERDAETGTGRLPGEWRIQDALVANNPLPDPLQVLLEPSPVARPWAVEPPSEEPYAVNAAFGELDEGVPPPSTAVQMSNLAAELAVRDLLTHRIKGLVIVRLAGRHWEQWGIADPARLPVSVDDLVRNVASRGAEGEPPTDGAALVLLAVFDDEDREPPPRGVQILAELGGERIERRMELSFDGDDVQLHNDRFRERELADDDRWVGVAPSVELDWVALPGTPEA